MVLALVERPLTLTLSPEGRGDEGGECGAGASYSSMGRGL